MLMVKKELNLVHIIKFVDLSIPRGGVDRLLLSFSQLVFLVT